MRLRLLPILLALSGTTAAPAAHADASMLPEQVSGSLSVLATGDSMVLHVAASLTEQLADIPQAAVRTDSHSGTGLSKPSLLDWPRYARIQARQIRPDVTIVFNGASDGLPFRRPSGRRKVSCCGRGWRQEYARVARRMMTAYSRGGRCRVYWLLLPQPRLTLSNGRSGVLRQQIYPAVNAAIRRAARGMGETVELVHLNRVLTPRGRYADTIVYRGRRVRVRDADGIHLSPDGASIAASIVLARMRTDGFLPTGGTRAP